VRTRADRVDGGWRLFGSKLWTSHAHRADYSIVLARTEASGHDRHEGLTQFVVEMRSKGVGTRPMIDLAGASDFNEMVLDDVLVPDEAVLGQPGQGWQLVTAELSLERSGPERYLSAHAVLEQLVHETRRLVAGRTSDEGTRALGAQVARLMVLRQMSCTLAAQIAAGGMPEVEAALVKDLGSTFEQSVADTARTLSSGGSASIQTAIRQLILAAPAFSLRGGTREILRGIIAKRLEAA
jgi:alkylation response protein AidB-like acyl-CoA dehydrogenase